MESVLHTPNGDKQACIDDGSHTAWNDEKPKNTTEIDSNISMFDETKRQL